MIVRANGVRTALFAVFMAAPCLAQETPAPTPAPTTAPAPAPAPASTATPAAPSKSLAGRGAVGGLIGGSFFYAADEYSKGAQPRFDFEGQFRYVMTRHFRFQVSPGLTWAAYSKKDPPPFTDPFSPGDLTKESYLTLLVPVSAQLQWVWGKSPWLYHVGAGPGIYRVWVENHRRVLMDPVTLRLHRGLYLGSTAQLGVERFLKLLPNTSIEVSVAHHYVQATRDDQFPTGWNSPISAWALRAGTNYYFDLNRPKKTTELPLPGLK